MKHLFAAEGRPISLLGNSGRGFFLLLFLWTICTWDFSNGICIFLQNKLRMSSHSFHKSSSVQFVCSSNFCSKSVQKWLCACFFIPETKSRHLICSFVKRSTWAISHILFTIVAYDLKFMSSSTTLNASYRCRRILSLSPNNVSRMVLATSALSLSVPNVISEQVVDLCVKLHDKHPFPSLPPTVVNHVLLLRLQIAQST